VRRLSFMCAVLLAGCLGGAAGPGPGPAPLQPLPPSAIRTLDAKAFEKTASPPMGIFRGDAGVDYWPYVASIAPKSPDLAARTPTRVYRNDRGTYLHVLIDNGDPPGFQVVVIDVPKARILGHRRVELLERYGIRVPPSLPVMPNPEPQY